MPSISFKPRCMCEGYGSCSLCVCLSVDTKATTYLVYTSKTRRHRTLCGVFKNFVVYRLSLRMFDSKVLASFAGTIIKNFWCTELDL